VGDGYISGLKIAVAKIGPPYVGRLVCSVTPRGGGTVATYACGSAGGLAVPLFKPVEALAAFNMETGCVAAASGRRRLAQTTKTLNLDALRVQAGPAPAGADAPVPTPQLNGVPLAGTLSADQLVAVAAANGVAAPTATPAPQQVVCTTTVTTSLTATSPFAAPVTLTVAAAGGGGGAGGTNDSQGGQGAAGGGGGSSAVVVRGGDTATRPVGSVAPVRVQLHPSHLCRSTAPRLWSPMAAQGATPAFALSSRAHAQRAVSKLARTARPLPPSSRLRPATRSS
jgi:hypothetical protein